VTLNAPVFVESAEGLAKRLLGESFDPKERLDLAFRLCLGRLPDADEREKFLSFLESHSAPSDLAKWQSLSTVLLNLDETITRP
jgi:hypothetical protein